MSLISIIPHSFHDFSIRKRWMSMFPLPRACSYVRPKPKLEHLSPKRDASPQLSSGHFKSMWVVSNPGEFITQNGEFHSMDESNFFQQSVSSVK